MSEINHNRGESELYPSCFGDHDWVIFQDPFSSVYLPLMRCFSCGMIQRYYGANMFGNIHLHQQEFNVRPFKPFFDIPDEYKGYAG